MDNNFFVLHVIDGVLDRLHAVAPCWDDHNGGPK
jgi:hypothetical protein